MDETTRIILCSDHTEIEGTLPNFEEYVSILFSALLQSMDAIVEDAPDPEKARVKSAVYDSVNQAATSVLDLFFPDRDPESNLSIEEIVMLADRVMATRLSELQKEDPAAYQKAVEEEALRQVRARQEYKKTRQVKRAERAKLLKKEKLLGQSGIKDPIRVEVVEDVASKKV